MITETISLCFSGFSPVGRGATPHVSRYSRDLSAQFAPHAVALTLSVSYSSSHSLSKRGNCSVSVTVLLSRVVAVVRRASSPAVNRPPRTVFNVDAASLLRRRSFLERLEISAMFEVLSTAGHPVHTLVTCENLDQIVVH